MDLLVRNTLIILGTFFGGMLIGMSISPKPMLTYGITIWIVTAVYGFLTRSRRLRG